MTWLSVSAIAAYAIDTMTLSPHWKVNVGGRWDNYNTHAVTPGDSANNASSHETFFSYQASLIYKPLEHGSIYLTNSTATTPQALGNGDQDQASGGTDFSPANTNVKPLKTDTVELGSKWSFLQDRLLLSGDVFSETRDNAQIEVQPGLYAVAGKTRVNGAEISASGNITAQWSVMAGYSYLDGTLVKGSYSDTALGKPLVDTPRNTVSLWTTYAIDPAVTVGGGAYYRDRQKFSADETCLNLLHQLGLRTTASLDTLLAAARYVQELQSVESRPLEGTAGGDGLQATANMDAAVTRGQALLAYLESGRLAGTGSPGGSGGAQKNIFARLTFGLITKKADSEGPSEADVARFWQELRRITWCPVRTVPPEVRPMNDMWLVSSSMHLLDRECRSSALSSGLGWSSPVRGPVLAQQLQHLGQIHATVSNQGIAKQLAGLVPQLYRLITELPDDAYKIASITLHGTACVWVGNGFAPAGKVSFKGNDLSPWLFVIPAELAPFKALLLSFGASESFSPAQYIALLQDMHTQQCAGLPPLALPQGLLLLPLQRLVGPPHHSSSRSAAAAAAEAAAAGNHCRADERGILRPSALLAHNDAPWLNQTIQSVHLVHPKLSNHVAGCVGVPSLRRLLLAQSSNSMSLGFTTGAEAFGQSESLTTRLKHIIQEYPEGPDFQGPALLVQNNAMFAPTDFENISKIGQDSKLVKPTSIGRFGLGFNATYHLTDLPSFVSGDFIVMFDPHARHLPNISPAQPGLKIAFQTNRVLDQFPDAFTPYLHFGCTLKEPYAGTMFRFPLRTPAGAAQSSIKRSPCSVEDMLQLFASFREQLPSALLFLKSVRTVSIFVSPSGGAAPRLLCRAQATSAADPEAGHGCGGPASELADGPTTLQAPITRFITGGDGRLPLADFYKNLASSTQLPVSLGIVSMTMEEVSHTVPVQLKLLGISSRAAPAPPPPQRQQPPVGLASGQQLQPFNSTPTVLALGGSNGGALGGSNGGLTGDQSTSWPLTTRTERWAVCNTLGAGSARRMALASQETSSGRLVPWVGVAAPLGSGHAGPLSPAGALQPAGSGGATGTALVSGWDGKGKQTIGRVFCFLPLPLHSSLPVHVNGYFELSSNRRDIWQGKDMSGAGAQRASWNTAIMQDALAPCYCRLLTWLVDTVGAAPELYSLFPHAALAPPWEALSSSVFRHLSDAPILWTKALAPRSSSSSLTDMDPRDVGCLGETTTRWITPTQAAFPDGAVQACPALQHLLLMAGIPLACGLPPHLHLQMLGKTPGAKQVTPGCVRTRLQQQLAEPSSRIAQYLTHWDPRVTTSGPAAGPTSGLAAASGSGGAAAATAVAPPPPTHPATLLLQYCMMDLAKVLATGSAVAQLAAGSVEAIALKELDGLALLPMADGSLAALSIELQADAAAACARGRGSASQPVLLLLLRGVEEGKLLGRTLPGRGVQAMCCSSHLNAATNALLQQLVDTGCSNIANLSCAALSSSILQHILPREWHKAGRPVAWTPGDCSSAGVEWHSAAPQQGQQQQQQRPQQQAASQHPTIEWVRRLWEWLKDKPLTEVMLLGAWPLLPIKGGELIRAQTPMTVLQEGDWADPVTSALVALGVSILDRRVIAAAQCSAIQAAVLPPTLSGALRAIASATQALLEDRRMPGSSHHHHAVPWRRRFLHVCIHAEIAVPPAGRCVGADEAAAGVLGIGAEVLLAAAEFINDEFAALSLEGTAANGAPRPAAEDATNTNAQAAPMTPMERLVARAKVLLHQLDLCASRTPGWGQGVMNAVLLDTPAAPAADEAAWGRLFNLTWCPVLRTAPHPGMPWRDNLPALCSPGYCRPITDAWLVSNSLLIVDFSVRGPTAAAAAPVQLQAAVRGLNPTPQQQQQHQQRDATPVATHRAAAASAAAAAAASGVCSTLLLERCGWASAVGIPHVTAQLLKLGRMHGQVGEGPLRAVLEQVAGQLYARMASELQDPASFDQMQMALGGEDAPFVWTGGGFTSTRRIAFRCWKACPSSKVTLSSYAGARRPAGHGSGLDVAQRLQVVRLANHPGIVELVRQAQAKVIVEWTVQLPPPSPLRPGPVQTPLCLPNVRGVMAPTHQLYFNDAAWLEGPPGKVLVHGSLPHTTCEALGVPGLKNNRQFVGSSEVSYTLCPSARTLQECLGQSSAGALSFLLDAMEVADLLGCPALKVVLDMRQHPATSLLEPGLAAAQGAEW
ncbi:MAG: hypothetical protein WDW38_008017 [Sanguina aurantia]